MNIQRKEKGFTIIEVVLVLAIAGLIFLMVFIALPSLQRSQRDSARQQEVGTVVSAIGTYSSSNNGKLPSVSTGGDSLAKIVAGDDADGNAIASGTQINVYAYQASVEGVKPGTEVSSTKIPVDYINVYTKATCDTVTDNNIVLKDGTTREAAVVTYLESGLMYCQNT